MSADVWQQLGEFAGENGWAGIAAEAGRLAVAEAPARVAVVAVAGLTGPGPLASWCAGAARLTVVPPEDAGQAWWAEKVLLALPAVVPEQVAPAVLAEVRRRWIDRPRGSCTVVTVIDPEGDLEAAEEGIRRTGRALRRLLRDAAADHLVWSPGPPGNTPAESLATDAKHLAAFLAAEPDEHLREHQRRRMIEALDERIAATPVAEPAVTVAPLDVARLRPRARSWLRRTEAEFLAGIDVVEQGLNRAATVGDLDDGRIEGRTTDAFARWQESAARDFADRWAELVGELSAAEAVPPPALPATRSRPAPPRTTPPARVAVGWVDMAAPLVVGFLAESVLFALTSRRNAQVGAMAAGAATVWVQRVRRQDAQQVATTRERIDGRRYIGEAAETARKAVRDSFGQTVGPHVEALMSNLAAGPGTGPGPSTDSGAPLLRAARDELAGPDPGPREEQGA